MTLRKHKERKTYSADIKHRVFGRVHLALKTKSKETAMTLHAALQQLLDTGEPVRDIVQALRAEKITIESVAECVRAKRPFDVLRASQWPTLGDAIDQFVAAQESAENIAENTAKSTEQALKNVREFFGAASSLDAITPDQVVEYKRHLVERGLETNTISLYLIKLQALYTFLQRRENRTAQQQRRVPALLFSPIDRVEHIPTRVKTRMRFLSEAEAERLLLATPDRFKAAIAIGIFAGLRVGEIQMLRVGIDVDMEQGLIRVQEREGWAPKYKKNRDIPISSALEPYVEAHLADLPAGTPYLFQGRGEDTAGSTTLFGIMRQIVDDAGLVRGRKNPEGVTFHTLRHTFASWLVMSGADLYTVAKLLGHTTTKQVEETYAHLSPKHKLATVEMLTARWLNRHTGAGTIQAPAPAETLQETL